MDVAAYVYLSTVVLIVFGLGMILRMSCKENKQARRRIRERNPNGTTGRRIELVDCSQPDESNIYNISSRVQGSTHQYPDAYISVDHIAITNELNKPPKYDDAPPSYDEAIKLATAQSNSIQTFQAEEATRQNQPQTSTATASVVPAVPSRTTE